MNSLNHDNQADAIEAFNSTSRYLDVLLNIDNAYLEGMLSNIYPHEVHMAKYFSVFITNRFKLFFSYLSGCNITTQYGDMQQKYGV